jgi:prephenate dehydrogenase
MNARDVNAELVRGKANPSFRDGTALMLNQPDEVADLLLKNSQAFIYMTAAFQTSLDQFGRAVHEGNWDEVDARILSAQLTRTGLNLPPVKNADTRPQYLLAPVSPA